MAVVMCPCCSSCPAYLLIFAVGMLAYFDVPTVVLNRWLTTRRIWQLQPRMIGRFQQQLGQFLLRPILITSALVSPVVVAVQQLNNFPTLFARIFTFDLLTDVLALCAAAFPSPGYRCDNIRDEFDLYDAGFRQSPSSNNNGIAVDHMSCNVAYVHSDIQFMDIWWYMPS